MRSYVYLLMPTHHERHWVSASSARSDLASSASRSFFSAKKKSYLLNHCTIPVRQHRMAEDSDHLLSLCRRRIFTAVFHWRRRKALAPIATYLRFRMRCLLHLLEGRGVPLSRSMTGETASGYLFQRRARSQHSHSRCRSG